MLIAGNPPGVSCDQCGLSVIAILFSTYTHEFQMFALKPGTDKMLMEVHNS